MAAFIHVKFVAILTSFLKWHVYVVIVITIYTQ